MAHPLLDRRDLTAQRERQPPAPEHHDARHADQLEAVVHALRDLRRQDRARIEQLCVTDREPAQSEMTNFPVPGACRSIVRRTGSGGLISLASNTPALVAGGNEARLGGNLVVSGAAAVILYLTTDLLTPGGAAPLGEGTPQIWLGAAGSWDFRLGDLLWCGSVIAVAQGAASQVAVAEV